MRLFIISLLLVLCSISVFAEVITSPLVDYYREAFGGIIADIEASQSDNNFFVKISKQTYSSSMQNFVGYSVSKLVFLTSQGTEIEGALAQSNPSNSDLASGNFPNIIFSAQIPENAVRAVVYYSVIGSGNIPEGISTSVEAHEQKTFTITSVTKTQPQPTLPSQPSVTIQPGLKLEKECSCLCQEICENKKIQDCPTIERLAGKASEYGTSGKVSGGFWKGGVVFRDNVFVGNCVGCSEAVNVQVQGINCEETCRQTCDTREGVAKLVASDAVKICFNTFADACSTLTPVPTVPSQPSPKETPEKEESVSDVFPPKKEELTVFQESERTEPARKSVPQKLTFTQKLSGLVKGIGNWVNNLFNKKLTKKKCVCSCDQVCDTTLVYGCAQAERTEKESGGKISAWGTLSGVVTNGNWKGVVEKKGKEFVGTCTVCSDKIIIADVASEAGNACDNPCNNACTKNSKTVQRGAGDECRVQLQQACA